MTMRAHGDAEQRDPSHRLVCESCRVDWKIASAWRQVERPSAVQEIAPREEFVYQIVGAVRRGRRAAARQRIFLAAAAALLFSFFAGLAHEQANEPRPAPEDTYASAVSPSALDGFIPN
jgi:hypothetical protein